MKQAQVGTGILVLGIWHLISLIKDAERYRANLSRWQAAPTAANLAKLLLAEGILIEDIAWLA
jgi:hypothetical protein